MLQIHNKGNNYVFFTMFPKQKLIKMSAHPDSTSLCSHNMTFTSPHPLVLIWPQTLTRGKEWMEGSNRWAFYRRSLLKSLVQHKIFQSYCTHCDPPFFFCALTSCTWLFIEVVQSKWIIPSKLNHSVFHLLKAICCCGEKINIVKVTHIA